MNQGPLREITDLMADGNTHAPAWENRLIETLETQQSLVDRLSELADRQGELIEGGRTDALLGLLSQRQRLIDDFVGAQEEVGRMTDGIDERLDGLPAMVRDRISSLIDEIGRRLTEVMAHDERDQGLLQTRRAGAKEELGSLSTAQVARNAYLGGSRPSGSRYADRRG